MDTRTVFVSDIHLEPARADITSQFVDYLESLGAETERLFIVGDLFEAWIGDDAPGPIGTRIIQQLARLSSSGIQGFFTHGNRDFLIGEEFSRRTGFTLLPDEHIVDCYGDRVLVMHGDSLCTDDVDYMRLRRMVRDPHWQADILSRSVEERLLLAQQMRQQSSAGMSSKSAEIMDVNQDQVEAHMRKHKVSLLLHGHTHRPNVHRFKLDGQTAHRIVLGDWYTQGSVVTWSATGFEPGTLRRL